MWIIGSQDTRINVFYTFINLKLSKKTHFSQVETAQIKAIHLRLISIAVETSASPTVIPWLFVSKIFTYGTLQLIFDIYSGLD